MRVSIDSEKLDLLANVISNKSGESIPMTLAEMTDAVDNIQMEPNLQSKTYTVDSAGTATITADAGYDGLDEVEVSVPSASFWTGSVDWGFKTESGVRKWKIEAKTIVETGEGDVEGWLAEGDYPGTIKSFNAVPANTSVTPTESAQTIGGNRYMMEGAVTVNAIPSNYVGTGITRRSSSDLTASGATVTAPAGYYESAATKTVASGNDFIITLTQNQSGNFIPDCTFAEYKAAYQAGKDISIQSDVGMSVGMQSYQSDFIGCEIYIEDYDSYKGEYYILSYGFEWNENQSPISAPDQTYYLTADATAVASDVAQGKTFFNGQGLQTGTATSGTPNLQAKTNISPTTSSQTITADSGYDGLSSVQINAMPIMTLPTSASSSSSGASKATIGRSTSAQYINIPTGYNGTASYYTISATPNGSAGTPTATKGTVSNHSVSVTPSVTNTTGYITGSTKTGTAVTVSASELVSGSQTITQNGTVDVTNLASVTVDVESSSTYTATITNNGAHRMYVRYDNTSYPTSGNSFVFSAGDTCSIEVYGQYGGASIYENNVQIGSSDNNSPFTYTLPAGNIEMIGSAVGSGGSARVDITVSDSGSIQVTALSVTANGTYTAPTGTAYSPVTVNVSGGGGGDPVSPKQINFIDYDGTIVKSYTKSEWQNVTALPSNPSHSGLTAQGWNWTKAQIDAQLTAMPDGDVWVGQMYITDDGKTRVYIHLEECRLHPYFGICPNGTVVVDWGDNSATSTLTGTSLSTVKVADHAYASDGDYMITLTVSSGSFAFSGVPNTSYILRKNTTTTSHIHKVYTNAVQKVELGSGATIGSNAFKYCSSLASITIPSGVTSIGDGAFYYCYSLASITIPSDVTSIVSNAFNSCYSLASITIPSGITSIGNNGFNACYSLASITIPSDVTSIETNAFSYCSSLASITIPSGVTSIGNNAFYYCYSLASITIPSNVTSIGSNAFSYCYSLTSITIPSDVTSVGNYAFNSCSSLASITIPSGVTSVGNYAFNSCYSLASITIPSDVTSIGNNAFSGCYGMAEYHIKPTTPPTLGKNVFQNIQSDCIIYVPSASLTAYQKATNWSTYASYMRGE